MGILRPFEGRVLGEEIFWGVGDEAPFDADVFILFVLLYGGVYILLRLGMNLLLRHVQQFHTQYALVGLDRWVITIISV